jgi:hypothetical protein
MKRIFPFLIIVILCFFSSQLFASGGGSSGQLSFPPALDSYNDSHLTSLKEILANHIATEPLNLYASLIFLCAILHTFMAGKFTAIAHEITKKHHEKNSNNRNKGKYKGDVVETVSFTAVFFHFLGEVEVVFGLWVLPLFWLIAYYHGIHSSVDYMSSVNFTEPMFVVIIMTLAATRPIMQLAEKTLKVVAKIGKESNAAWWFTILTVGPILGSFITEPAAMTISALILAKQFYQKKPSVKFAYATIGLLFVNISVGGTLSHFAAPPVLMVAGKWNWDMMFMATNFGWKAFVGIILANILYFFIFRAEFSNLTESKPKTTSDEPIEWHSRENPVPFQITLVHIIFMVWTVATAHYPPLFIGGFLCFLGFAQSTAHHQNKIDLKPALLVGFFLAGLVTHGGLQSWWIAPILGSLSELPLMLGATILTAFNDNAAITYLSTLVPNLGDSLKYAVVAGAVTGGGLTVIANAPNPAGQSILQRFFKNGVSPLGLALSAIIPTVIMGCAFMLLP